MSQPCPNPTSPEPQPHNPDPDSEPEPDPTPTAPDPNPNPNPDPKQVTIAEETLRFGVLPSLDASLSSFASPAFARPLTAYSLTLSASASAPQLSRASRASRAATAAPRTHSPPRDASPRHTSFAAGVPLRASLAQTSHQGGAALLRELHALADHSRPHRAGSPGSRGARSAPSAFLLSGGVYEGALASVLPRALAWGGPGAATAAALPPHSPSGAIRVVGLRRVAREAEAAWQGEAWHGLSLDRLTPHGSPRARKRMASARLGTEMVEAAARDGALQVRQPLLLPEREASPLPPPRAAQSASSSGRAAARIQASTVQYATPEKLFASVMAQGGPRIKPGGVE